MISSTLERLGWDVKAAAHCANAALLLEGAALVVAQADLPSEVGEHHVTEALEHLVRRQARTISDRVLARATQLGWQVATYEIAPLAKESGSEAVVFITGNSHVPSLRAFGISDEVWQLDYELTTVELFPAYAEAIERRLDELHVHMTEPEYDNALYVVDLDRFEPEEGEDETTWIGRA